MQATHPVHQDSYIVRLACPANHNTVGRLAGQGAAGSHVQELQLTWEKASDPILLILALPLLPVSGSAKENWPAERMMRPCSESLVPSEEPWDRAREPRRMPLAVLAACKQRRHMCRAAQGFTAEQQGLLHYDHTQGGSAYTPCIAQQSLKAPAGTAEQIDLACGHSSDDERCRQAVPGSARDLQCNVSRPLTEFTWTPRCRRDSCGTPPRPLLMQQPGPQLYLVAVSICVRQSHAAKAVASAATAVAECI